MENEFNNVVDATMHAQHAGTNAVNHGLDQVQDVSGQAREYMQKSSGLVKERVADIHANTAKVTDAVEGRMVDAIGETAKVGREWQEAVFKDADAFWSHFGKLASAKNLSEAVEVQKTFLHERTEVVTARVKTATDFVSKIMGEGAKAVQDGVAQVKKAA